MRTGRTDGAHLNLSLEAYELEVLLIQIPKSKEAREPGVLMPKGTRRWVSPLQKKERIRLSSTFCPLQD